MTKYISVVLIKRNPQQPRQIFDTQKLEGMMKTIKRHGVIEPIVVYRDDQYYILIDGERRWLASKMAGKKRIRADIRRKPANGEQNNLADISRLEQALITNIQREDMGPVEEGDAYLALMDKYGLSQREVARRLGIPYVRVNNSIVFARSDQEIRDLINSGQLYKNLDLMRALMDIPVVEVRIEMARGLAAKKRGLEASIKAANLAAKACTKDKPQEEDSSSSSSSKGSSGSSRVAGQDKPPRWDALLQLGKLPPWELVVNAVNLTCQACSLEDIASAQTCSPCPAVDLLNLMVEEAK